MELEEGGNPEPPEEHHEQDYFSKFQMRKLVVEEGDL
jgi:hypothetical protein